MTALDLIRLGSVEPLHLLGLQLELLDRLKRRAADPALLIFQFPGEIISLGRYHRYSGPVSRAGLGAYRRLTGGRIINPAPGWLGCSLILPSRSAAQGEHDTIALRPEQVMNRCVRGAMAAMRTMDADCFYPGRDAITCGGRELAMCTFEEDRDGALLFELFVAIERGLESLPLDMERFDPEGVLTCRLYDAGTCTSMARELGRAVSFDELAGHLETGYGALSGRARTRDLTAEERAAAERQASQLAAKRWLNGRTPDASMSLVGRQSIQLGTMEAHVAASGDHLEGIRLYGDFIANSAGLDSFEQNLRGKRLDLITLTSATLQFYGKGADFMLGCGDLGNLARLILSAS